MTRYSLTSIVPVLVLVSSCAGGLEDSSDEPALEAAAAPIMSAANHHVFLAIGQSNMAGRATIETQDLGTIPEVYLLAPGDTTWELATNPMNKYSTCPDNNPSKLGPTWTFSKGMRAGAPEVSIGIIGNARGATYIREWMPGTSYFNKAVARAQAAKASGTLKGILWHQGEWDKTDTAYVSKLATVIQGFRDALGDPNLLFVAGQIGQLSTNATFNQNILTLPSVVPNTAVVSSVGTTLMSDNLHFNPASQRIMGQRYADAVLAARYARNYESENLAYTGTNSIVVGAATGLSGGKHLKLLSTTVGNYIEFTLPQVPAGAYKVEITVAAYPDRGIFQTSIDGVNQGSPQDQYISTSPWQPRTFNLGTKVFATTANHTLRMTVTGKNASSSNRVLSSDRVLLTRVP